MVETKITAEPGKSTIIATGVFDAPRQIVWEACTEPVRYHSGGAKSQDYGREDGCETGRSVAHRPA